MATRRSARISTLSALSAAAAGKNGTANPKSPHEPPPKAPAARSRKRGAAKTDKAAATAPEPGTGTVVEPTAPITPPRKRPRTSRKVQPATTSADGPATPTPALGAVDPPTEAAPSTRLKHRAVNRLADPTRTNAPLISPQSSRVILAGTADGEGNPSADLGTTGDAHGVAATLTTTATLLEEACAHLIRVDKRMRPLIEKHHCRLFSPEGLAEEIDPFESLISSIISQQVSGAAAKSIKARFVGLFESGPEEVVPPAAAPSSDIKPTPKRDFFPTPSQVAAIAPDQLRTAGLSQRKAEYVSGLAAKFAAGELTARMLADAPYDEVLERLTAVRGLGKWSVEMFACFALKRMDVFSLGDLGVQRGMAAFVGRDVAKLKSAAKGGKPSAAKWKYMSEQDMVELSDRFKPYRSLFMWYMWRVEDTDISTLE